ncbi:MAG: DUF4988 domain-containing protein, partial [Muribaculaceae bacterium]|nr:DUF4988 domain-containing protein [Muribaculaceae bacterium]
MTNRNYLFLLIILLNLFSCSDYDTEIKNLQDRVDKLEDTVSALKSALNSGKIISDVISLPDNQGYNLIFSDGSNISFKQGTDNMIPMVKIDNNGFWIVSYDDGNSYSHILDNNGNQVISKGKDGSNGNSLRVVTDDNGFYNFEVYSSSLPDSVIEVIKTPQSSNQESVLCSVVKDEKNGVITLTLANGSEFKFNLDVSYPTSVIVLNDILKVSPFEDASLLFRLNPSDAYLDFIINGDESNIELDIVTLPKRGITNYITTPSGYEISSISYDTDADGNIKQGQYIATISSLNNGENLSERVCLVITTKNSKGESIQISSNPFSIING